MVHEALVPTQQIEHWIFVCRNSSPPVMKTTLPERSGMAFGLKEDIMIDGSKRERVKDAVSYTITPSGQTGHNQLTASQESVMT